MSTKVNPQELIVLHKEDFKTLTDISYHVEVMLGEIKAYPLTRFREEALEEGLSLSIDMIYLENENMSKNYISNYVKSQKQEFLTKEIEL